MGLFSKNKKEETPLPENEFKFSGNIYKYIINENSLCVQNLNRKGKLINEEHFNFRQIEKIDNGFGIGNLYRVEIKLANEKKTPSIRVINYDRKKESDKINKFIAMLSNKLN